MFKLIKTTYLKWITDNDVLYNDVPTDICGIVSLKSNEFCDNIIFINKDNYKHFSPIFSYTLKKDKQNIYFPLHYPQYYNNKFKSCIGISNIDNYVVICDNNYDLFSWNPKTMNVYKILFEKKIIVDEKDVCTDNTCGCKPNKLKLPSLENKPKEEPVRFIDELMTITGLDIKFINFAAVENYIIFGFQIDNYIFLSIISYTKDGNKIIFKRNATTIKYNIGCNKLVDLVYNNKTSKLLILTKNSSGGDIWYIKWHSVFKNLNYTINMSTKLYNIPSAIGKLSNGNIIITYSNNCKDNKFRCDILV